MADSSAYNHHWCVNTINCTGKIAPQSLLEALSTADAQQYLCSEEHRPGEKMSSSFHCDWLNCYLMSKQSSEWSSGSIFVVVKSACPAVIGVHKFMNPEMHPTRQRLQAARTVYVIWRYATLALYEALRTKQSVFFCLWSTNIQQYTAIMSACVST